jgi:hypothetical protein
LTYIRGRIPIRIYVAALGIATVASVVASPSTASAGGSGGVGGYNTTPPTNGQTTPGSRARLRDGLAIPPANAPARVVRAIEAANSIESKPYEYGGGHETWIDNGYDCSGAVSFALGKYGARVLDSPMPSGSFINWGEPGPGRWITTYANKGHMYVVIAGLRWDTSQTPGDGPGWSKTKLVQPGYSVRHPAGL